MFYGLIDAQLNVQGYKVTVVREVQLREAQKIEVSDKENFGLFCLSPRFA